MFMYLPLIKYLLVSVSLLGKIGGGYHFLIAAVRQMLRPKKRLQSRKSEMLSTTGLMVKGHFERSNSSATWTMKM